MNDRIRYYRSQAEANAKREEALAYVRDLELLLPPGSVRLDYETVFVGRTARELVGCVAVTIPGAARSLTVLEFELSEDPNKYVDSLTPLPRQGTGRRAVTLDRIPDDAGRYRVTTQSGSVYLFDMAERTVTRTPGDHSHPDFSDGLHRLRSIVEGQLGVSGFWTLRPDTPELESLFEYMWQLTSPIVAIEAISEG